MFIGRRADRSLYGCWSVRQPDDADHPGQEELANNDPELVTFLNPLPDARLAAIDNSIAAGTIGSTQPATIAQLKAMSAAEYSTWFDANFGTAATLITLLKRLLLIVIRRAL